MNGAGLAGSTDWQAPVGIQNWLPGQQMPKDITGVQAPPLANPNLPWYHPDNVLAYAERGAGIYRIVAGGPAPGETSQAKLGGISSTTIIVAALAVIGTILVVKALGPRKNPEPEKPAELEFPEPSGGV